MLRAKSFLLSFMLVWGVEASSQSPENFCAAKMLLAEVHAEIGHSSSLYCGCDFVRAMDDYCDQLSGGDIDRESCGLKARKNEDRSDRIEWEHVVPASWFGNTRSCWTQGNELCVNDKGKAYKGRNCCLTEGVDPEFMAMHNDPNNLFPSEGELNGDRRNYPYGTVKDEHRVYGTCDFEVGGKPRVAEIAQTVQGEVARAMLYMRTKYDIDVKQSYEQLLRWHADDPPKDWETERAKKIAAKTNFRNTFIIPLESTDN